MVSGFCDTEGGWVWGQVVEGPNSWAESFALSFRGRGKGLEVPEVPKDVISVCFLKVLLGLRLQFELDAFENFMM